MSEEIHFCRRAFQELSVAELYELLRLRGDVFVVEQGVSEENDVDGRDPECVHVLGRDAQGDLVAAARMLMVDSPILVSRVVVREDARGRGVGTALMRTIETYVGSCRAEMSAQAHLEAWYTRHGWVREGEVYDEVGIPHLKLVRPAGERPGEA